MTIQMFFDFEFTGLHQFTTPISLGIVAETEQEDCFYAEFTDYDKSQVDNWVEENVIKKLYSENFPDNKNWIQGTKEQVTDHLKWWLEKYKDKNIEFWGDVCGYDWVLFNQLFGHALNTPKNIFYIPFDLATAFKVKGISLDMAKVNAITKFNTANLHNSLYDAQIIKECYKSLNI